jgi:hypothetical protein
MIVFAVAYLFAGAACVAWIALTDEGCREPLKRKEVFLVALVALLWPIFAFVGLCQQYEELVDRWADSDVRAKWNAWWDKPLLSSRHGKGEE